ncbi:uncharacterized protein SPPG_07923 [Spizellomyces punctatus DAOM BR117]|uniref:Peptidase A1 domain-containing protein n=1 Tax=Spizellomyces punctatus (strain DAOM BR117) TaxID=645134 RepID=A0A0L0H7P9_SPIPD|nr:uncharacterized protein SPPG_07923 [Spizellomyces punctatus DAOM BR117]KNC96713.1 hypothetical protein SPPG_07923 [Spizellomyces punctatus DAOM BR117]|eukprot:XP_016604753.1 hypothetical protein SPPG_07923 [Spizellomyces punctatus DAOM BR117]
MYGWAVWFLVVLVLVQHVDARNVLSIPRNPKSRKVGIVSLNFQLKQKALDANVTGQTTVIADSVSHTLITTIGVGTPAQVMAVQIDTGSSLFWLRSSKCRGTSCSGQPVYDNTKSTSYLPPAPATALTGPQRRSIVYGDNTKVECQLGADTVMLGTLVIPNQTLCEADVIQTTTGSSDGLIGLGPPGADTATDVFRNMIASKTISKPVASFWYNQSRQFSDTNAGQITFGGMDSSKFTGSFTWFPIPITGRNHWSTTFEGITLDSAPLTQNRTGMAIFDTGTTLAIIPSDTLSAIVLAANAKQLPNQSLYEIPCDKVSRIPPVTFHIGQRRITLFAEQQVFVVDGTCFLIYAASTSNLNVDVILGALFLRHFYTVFDFGASRTGLAISAGQVANSLRLTGKSAGSRVNVDVRWAVVLGWMVLSSLLM